MEEIIGFDQNTSEGKTSGNFIIIKEEKDFIQENVFIKTIEFKENYFEVTIEKDGATANLRKYIPSRERAKSEDSYKKAVEINTSLLANIGRRFMGEKYAPQSKTWEDMILRINKDCSSKFSSTPLRCKLTLELSKDNKYFTKISPFAPFENMNIACGLYVSNKDKEALRAANELREANKNITPDSDESTPGVEEKLEF